MMSLIRTVVKKEFLHNKFKRGFLFSRWTRLVMPRVERIILFNWNSTWMKKNKILSNKTPKIVPNLKLTLITKETKI
jgi:hypothetical protein